MLELTMTGDDPQLITRILNSIANSYLQQNIARRGTQDSQSLEFLQRQLPESAQRAGPDRKKTQRLSPASAIQLTLTRKPKPFLSRL